MARGRLAYDLKLRRTSREILGSDRIPVHCGRVEGGLGSAGVEVRGEKPTERRRQRYGFDLFDRPNVAQEPLERFVEGNERHAADQSPDRPPDFSRRRMPVIDMPRSTAFAMS